MRTVKCAVCGKEFTTSHHIKITCSADCAVALRKIRRETKRYKKICTICGKEFVASDPKKKTCSKKCAYTVQKHGMYQVKDAEPVDMRRWHSDTLDRKAKTWGYNYGKMQSAETLAMVPKIDVNAILSELGVSQC